MSTFFQIKEQIEASSRILLISHHHPDGDACGSLLAMYEYLLASGKEAAIYVNDPPATYFDFLPHLEACQNDRQVFKKYWDTIIYLDSGDINHTKTENYIIFSNLLSAKLINIDHHISNNRYGHLNFIDSHASSTCEIIYEYFKKIDFQINKRIATNLLNGILNDTGGFTNAATSIRSMQIASDLIRYGASINKIMDRVIRNKSLDALKLWGLILSRLKINRSSKIVSTYVTEDDFEKFNVKQEDIDGIVNFMNIINEGSFCLFMKIYPEEIKVSLRTTKDDVDLAKLAGRFGGGGHKKAAGFTVRWQFSQHANEVLLT